MKTLIRTIMIIGFFVIGTLVLSQNSIDNLAPEEQGLRTQAINTCSALFCDRVEVRQFYLNTNGFLYVSTSGIETGLTCTPVSTNYLRISETAKNYKEIFTTLLAAKFNNETVNIKTTGASTCTILLIQMGPVQ